jgi:hypothetical protein
MFADARRIKLVATALIVLCLAACGSSGDSGRGGGGLIDQGPGNGSTLRPPVLSMVGPTTGSPGVDLAGFRVEVSQAGRTAAEGVGVTLTATNGTVSIVERGVTRPGLGSGLTDAFGRLNFIFTPDPAVTTSSTGVVTATITDPRYIDICFDDLLAVCAGTLAVSIQQDDFRFTAPVFGSAITVGSPNAQRLQLTWRNANGQPVVNPNGGNPCVDLETRFSGSGTAPAGIIISGDPTPRAQRRRVQLNASGNFVQTVSVFSDLAGFLEIDALENRTCSAAPTGELIATTGVQFIDEFCEQSADGRDCVDLRLPLALTVVPDAAEQSSVELVMEVRNSAFQPINGAQVLFRILSPSVLRPNERVFPGGGTTDANGLVRSDYYAPNISAESLVDIEACVRAAGSGDQTGQFCRRRQLTLRPPPTSAPAP